MKKDYGGSKRIVALALAFIMIFSGFIVPLGNSIVKAQGAITVAEAIQNKTPKEVTISELKKSKKGDTYKTKGIVISKVNAWGGNGFYIQDETAGLYVYPGKLSTKLNLGDKVEITGTLGEYANALQLIKITDLKVTGQKDLPVASELNLAKIDTKKLDTLVKLNKVKVMNFRRADDKGTVEFIAMDEAGNQIKVRHDYRSGIGYDKLSEILGNGAIINLEGVLSKFYKDYQIKPFELTQYDVIKEAPKVEVPDLPDGKAKIGQIQGEGHFSPYNGQKVTVEDAVVTQVRSANGFFIQDIVPDNNPKTSDGIYVYQKDHGLKVGDKINITGVVDEYMNSQSKGMTPTTQLTRAKITKTGTASLPEPVLINDAKVPRKHIDNDGLTAFEPDDDAIDFWESVEGMLVAVENPKILGPVSYGTIYTLPGDTSQKLNSFGAYRLQENYNPNVVPLYVGRNSNIIAKAGDSIKGKVVGVVDWEYSQPKIYADNVTQDMIVKSEKISDPTSIKSDKDSVTIASYNIENYTALRAGKNSTSDERSKRIASSIVNELNTPDIVILIEVQDNDGQAGLGNVDASKTGQRLVDDIKAAGGPEYVFIDKAPEKEGTNGGAPGANIRNAMIYRKDRVKLESTDVLRFKNTRDLLIANFDYQGNKLAVLAAHLNSKRGDTTLFGLQQPPVLGSVAWRVDLATKINQYAQKRLEENPDLNLVIGGDLNDFEFSKSVKALKGDILTNLVDKHDENDRFSYFFNGNAQVLDHILVNNKIANYVEFDMVHINALYMETHGRASDHDPVISKIHMPVTEEKEEKEEIPFEIKRVENPDLEEGVEKIKVAGVKGTKTSKVKITRRNGVEVKREVLSVDEKAPVTQVVEYGSKKVAGPDHKEKEDLNVINNDGKAIGKLEIKWELGQAKDFQIRLNAEFGTKLTAKLDGKEISVKTTKGSTIVHLAKEDLAKLEVGRHNLELSFAESRTTKAGTVNIALVVEKSGSSNSTTDNNQGQTPSGDKNQNQGQKPSGNGKQGQGQSSSAENKKKNPNTADISIFLPAFITLASAGAYIFADKRKK